MSTKKPRIKINQIYRHPQRGVVVIHFEFDDGYRSNVNIPPEQLRGLTQQEMQEHIKRTLNNLYEQRKRDTAEQKQKIANTVSALDGLQIE